MTSTCPNPEFHGNPFRYCSCGWTEAAAALAAQATEGDAETRLEAMCDRLAERHVVLQEAIAAALNDAREWRDKLPRTRENDTYANGRQDGVTAAVLMVDAALKAHLRELSDPRPAQVPDISARVRKLADEWERQYSAPIDQGPGFSARPFYGHFARQLRALLDTLPARGEDDDR